MIEYKSFSYLELTLFINSAISYSAVHSSNLNCSTISKHFCGSLRKNTLCVFAHESFFRLLLDTCGKFRQNGFIAFK